MGILRINLNNINLDKNFDENDSDTIILMRLLDFWQIKFEKGKALKRKISGELIAIAWNLKI